MWGAAGAGGAGRVWLLICLMNADLLGCCALRVWRLSRPGCVLPCPWVCGARGGVVMPLVVRGVGLLVPGIFSSCNSWDEVFRNSEAT